MPMRGGYHYRQHTTLKNYIRERDNHTYQVCGAPGNIIDHVIPYAISHNSFIPNLRVLCHACNLKLRRPRYDVRLPLSEYWEYVNKEVNHDADKNCPHFPRDSGKNG